MEDSLRKNTLAYAGHLAVACGLPAAVFDFQARGFLPEAPCTFCSGCEYHTTGRCDYGTAHRYGCFEAERWNGLYIYYCPMSLAFVATVVFQQEVPAYAIVAGPAVMGQPEDVLSVNGGVMEAQVAALPQRTPAQMNAAAQTQWAVAMYLAGRPGEGAAVQAKASLLNSLYDVAGELREGSPGYPFEIEQRLQRMITSGDKQGAQGLINQLLGALYFETGGDFAVIKQQAKELIVLFSRASVAGGADAKQIFGQHRGQQAEIDRFKTLDELSAFLTSVFNRFVGYVFDFGSFEHADIMHKSLNYLRGHYAEKITLEDVAAHVGLSRSYLSTLFRDELGATFTDTVNALRVEKSRALLLETQLGLAEIANLVGYYDQSYFTKVFTRATGVSPGQYRKKRGSV